MREFPSYCFCCSALWQIGALWQQQWTKTSVKLSGVGWSDSIIRLLREKCLTEYVIVHSRFSQNIILTFLAFKKAP